jgi:hypothetical protein
MRSTKKRDALRVVSYSDNHPRCRELDGEVLPTGPKTYPTIALGDGSSLMPTGFLSYQTDVFLTIKNGIAVRPDNTQDRNLASAL